MSFGWRQVFGLAVVCIPQWPTRPEAVLSSGIDPAYVSAAAAIATAAVAAMVAVYLHLRTQAEERNERKRQACARALADAISWLEMPYRIRRRVDDNGATLAALSERVHALQEALHYHESWLAIEAPEAAASYRALVLAVRAGAKEQMRAAWEAQPIGKSSDMNLRGASMPPNVQPQIADFVNEVRKCTR